MSVRPFDIVGVIAVGAWLTVLGLYVYEVNFAEEQRASEQPSGIVLTSGESWMILTRDDEQVGVIHETRTPIEDGWLLEYDLLMNISSLGTEQLLETSIKATVDKAAYLRKVSGRVQTALTAFDLAGTVNGNEVVLSYTIDENERERRIQLKEPPRLSSSVFNQLAAQSGSLTPGDVFEQEYFDPMVMGMTNMRFEYVRQHQVEVYDTVVDTYHFKQQIAGTELDVYVDAKGDVHIQELPLRIVAARIPPALGLSRSKALRSKFESAKKKGAAEISVDEAVGFIRGAGSITSRSKYKLTNLPEGLALILDSGAQKATSKTSTSAEVDTAERAGPQLQTEQRLEEYKLAPADVSEEAAAKILEDTDELKGVQLVEKIARNVANAIEFDGDSEHATGNAAFASGKGTSSAMAELTVGVLRKKGVPARYVLGAEEIDGKWVPRYWAQAWNNDRFVDLDPTRTTLIPGVNQIQLSVSEVLDRETFEPHLEALKISRVEVTPEADFN